MIECCQWLSGLQINWWSPELKLDSARSLESCVVPAVGRREHPRFISGCVWTEWQKSDLQNSILSMKIGTPIPDLLDTAVEFGWKVGWKRREMRDRKRKSWSSWWGVQVLRHICTDLHGVIGILQSHSCACLSCSCKFILNLILLIPLTVIH